MAPKRPGDDGLARGEAPAPALRAKDAVVITPYRDGPLLIRGPFRLLDSSGAPIPNTRTPVALCRCGRSRTKPFCDGTHKQTGFTT